MNFAHSCLAINCYFYKLSKRIYFLFYFHYFHPLSTTRLLPCIYHHSDTLLKPSRHWHHGYYKEVCICVCLPFSRWAQTLCDAAFFLTKKKKKTQKAKFSSAVGTLLWPLTSPQSHIWNVTCHSRVKVSSWRPFLFAKTKCLGIWVKAGVAVCLNIAVFCWPTPHQLE